MKFNLLYKMYPFMLDEEDNHTATESYSCEEDIDYCKTYKGIKKYLLNPTDDLVRAFKPDPLSSLIPQCYTKLANVNPNIKYLHEETLFYIFYNIIGQEVQLQAYKALIERRYYFHTKMNMFVKFGGDKIADDTIRRITYFDVYSWQREAMDVVFNKEFIENLKDLN